MVDIMIYKLVLILTFSLLIQACLKGKNNQGVKTVLPFYSGCIDTVNRLKNRFNSGGVVEISSVKFNTKMYQRERIIGYLEFTLKDDSNLLVPANEYMEVFVSSFFSDCMPESSIIAGDFKSFDRTKSLDGIYNVEGDKVYFYYNDGSYQMPDK